MVLTLTAWAAITISLKKGSSYDLRLRTWHCSSTLCVFNCTHRSWSAYELFLMKKLLVLVLVLFCALSCFAQKDVTRFLGFPVDGTESEMIRNLKSKGFKLTTFGDKNVLTGRFNGNDVRVYISTENGKVDRIAVCDINTVSETDIKIRFNRLCKQFEENGKYLSLGDYTIPENEDISYEMSVNNKRYEAIFYQLPEGEAKEQLQTSLMKEATSKYTPEQLVSPNDDIVNEITFATLDAMLNVLKNKPVWFMITKSFGEYYITMFYDNEYNRANGEEL